MVFYITSKQLNAKGIFMTINKTTTFNVLGDQIKNQRSGMIKEIKVLREDLAKLKGVKGTSLQWKQLVTKIQALQSNIDLLSKSLGIPVEKRNVVVSPKPVVQRSRDVR